MRAPYTQLYLHLVWSTWDRLPLVTADIEASLYTAIAEKCRELGCLPIAIGGVEDHVHLLVRFPTTIAVARLVKEVKGSSSHLVTHVLKPGLFFKWQGSYGAFTVAKDGIISVETYIRRQKEHHQRGTLQGEWEVCEEPKVEI